MAFFLEVKYILNNKSTKNGTCVNMQHLLEINVLCKEKINHCLTSKKYFKQRLEMQLTSK